MSPPFEKAKILLVDDRPENLLALEGVLRGDDREIYRASSGVEALGLLLENRFAVALLDVQMPDMNGFELAELMRDSDDTQTIPIIFVTAGVRDAASTFRGFEAGAVDFLHKPLDERIVRSKVRVFLELDRKSRLLEEKIAQLEKSERELTASQEELASSNKELERFVYIASHDIKEPLRLISTYLSLISNWHRDKFDAKSIEFMDYTLSAAKRLGILVQSLVMHSKAGHQPLRLVETDLNPLLQDVVKDLTMSIAEKQAKLNIAHLPTLKCDGIQIRQLFQNLMSNAIKFSNGRSPEVSISSEREDGRWVFSISDNGIGIPGDQLEKIFEPFVRGHGRDKYQGDGIGLSVCKTIVQRHGGTITAQSKPGEGSTFKFSIADLDSETAETLN